MMRLGREICYCLLLFSTESLQFLFSSKIRIIKTNKLFSQLFCMIVKYEFLI
jgi:hypothetical protein